MGTISPDMNTTRSFLFRVLQDYTNWNASRNDAGKIEDPVCNSIFKNAGCEIVFEVKKVEGKISNYIHIDLTYSNLNQLVSNKVDLNHTNPNQSGSKKVDSNHTGSNPIATHQSESNHVKFDPANLTNKSRYIILILIFYVAYYHGVVVNLLQEKRTLLMVRNLPTTIHRLLGEDQQARHQKLVSHLLNILHH